MIDIEVEENRLLARATTATDRVLLRHFPGARWVPARARFSLPRQMGTYALLDHLFGRDGWRPPASLSEELNVALTTELPPPAGEAELEDLGDEFAVRSGFADRELVKRVPGYRWVPQEKRWRLPRVPATLEILQEKFGTQLRLVDEEVVSRWFEEAKERIEQELARARAEDAAQKRDGEGGPDEAPGPDVAAGGAVAARGMAAESGVGQPLPASTVAGEGAAVDADGAGLLARLDRLTVALERLVAALERGVVAAGPGGVAGPATVPEPAGAPEGVTVESEGGPDWRDLLDQVLQSPDEALRQSLEGRLGSAEGGDAATLSCLLGFWHLANERWADAVTWFGRAFARDVAIEQDLEAEAKRGYRRAAMRLLPEPLWGEAERLDAAAEVLANELVRPEQLVEERIIEELRSAADDLAADSQLARRLPELHSLARFAQFFAAARRRARVDEQRLGEFIRDPNVPEKTRALALVLLANVLLNAESVTDWQMQWPRDVRHLGDFAWVAGTALEVLPKTSEELPKLAPFGAISALAIIAQGPREWATLEQRKGLLRHVDTANPLRGYAEFLAAYQLAAGGSGKGLDREFKGYFEHLKKVRLDESWPHLSEVLANDTNIITNLIVDEVLPAALEERGVGDVAALMDAADFAVTTQRGDNTLNRIADGVEDGSIPGAEALDGEQRLKLFKMALEAAKKKTHDQDADRAFIRLVRELIRQGRESEIPNLCAECREAFPALKERALLGALEWALESGQPYEEPLNELLAGFREKSPRLEDLKALVAAFPELEKAGGERLAKLIGARSTKEEAAVDLSGKTVLVVGGHPSLMAKAKPELTGLGLDVEWLDAEAAKQGGRAVDRASGSVDLVVVNVAYIGHAGSERVIEAAKGAENRYLARAFTGPRMLVSAVRRALEAADEGDAGKNGRGGRRR